MGWAAARVLNMGEKLRIAIVGGGPAGLMAAEVISGAGHITEVYEGKPSVGRKFLIAGKGGLNLTHSEPREHFLSRYFDRRSQLEKMLDAFGPNELRLWAESLGYETFVGTSGRVFPVGMQAAPLLKAWTERLKMAGVRFHFRHYWRGWTDTGELLFEANTGQQVVRVDALVLAMGGASWPQTGSDGGWVPLLAARGIGIAPLEPANCGFDVAWSEHIRARFAGEPVKSVVLEFVHPGGMHFRQQGEFVVTTNGIEGSLVYAASKWIRETIRSEGAATIHLDLAPDLEEEPLLARLSRPRGSKTIATHLQRQAGIRGVKAALLREVIAADVFQDPAALAAAIKHLPVKLEAPRPIEEAISTAGGVPFDELDDRLMLAKLPGVFCAGEMLDWEAPTGGYLLTASMATGRAAGLGVVNWLSEKNPE